MKFCSSCGKQLDDKVTVCVHCGYELERAEKPAEAKQPLKTDRKLSKFVLLSIVTLGIYYIIEMTNISKDIHTIAFNNDRKATIPYWLMFFFYSWLSLFIAPICWYHRISARIGGDLEWRGIDYSFGAKDFWLWHVLGSLILVGPFIYYNKLLTAMNLLSEAYNKEEEISAEA